MSKLHTGALTAAAVATLLFGSGFDQACAAAGTGTQQQAAAQSKDAPGADDNGQAPLAQQDGVIKPPRLATRASTLKSPIPMPGLAMRFPRRPKCPAARTQNRNRCGGNEGVCPRFSVSDLPPVKTRLPSPLGLSPGP